MFTKVGKPTSGFSTTGKETLIFRVYDAEGSFRVWEGDSKRIVGIGSGLDSKVSKASTSFTKVGK